MFLAQRLLFLLSLHVMLHNLFRFWQVEPTLSEHSYHACGGESFICKGHGQAGTSARQAASLFVLARPRFSGMALMLLCEDH